MAALKALLCSALILALLGPPMILPMWRAHQALDWAPASCTIVDEPIQSHDQHDLHHHGLSQTRHIDYRYEGAGREHESDHLDFSALPSATADDVAERAKPGDQIPCWYDPDAPDHAVLARTGWPADVWSWILFVATILLCGVFALMTRPERGGRGAIGLVPCATLTGLLVAAATFAYDGGTGGSAAMVLTVIALAAVVWLVAEVLRWRAQAGGGLPDARVQSQ